MGNTAKTRVRIGGKSYDADALLETSELIVRGEKRLRVPFSEVRSPRAENGALSFVFNGDDVVIELGKDAPKWLEKIVNPKSVIEKLGVKAGHRVSLVNLDHDSFARDVELEGATITRGKNLDLIFY